MRRYKNNISNSRSRSGGREIRMLRAAAVEYVLRVYVIGAVVDIRKLM
jgi:hypothetical protein